MKNKLFDIANMPKYGYICRALSKISKLVLADYKFSQGVQPTFYSGFFVRNISMRSHVMAKLGRDTFECVGSLVNLSANPLLALPPKLLGGNRQSSNKSQGAH